jgi:hypothetical protein
MAVRTIELSLDLVLDRSRVGAVIAPHALKLVADIVRDPRVDLGLFLEILLAEPADRVRTTKIELFVMFAISIVTIGRGATEANVAVGG